MADRKLTVLLTADDQGAVRVIDNVGDAAQTADRKVDDLTRSSDRMGDALGGVADSGGNTERALTGVADITGFLGEQFGLNIGPLSDYAGTFAQLGGGIEAALQGGPALLAQLKTLPATLAPAIAATWAHVSALTAQAVAFIAANAPILILIASVAAIAAGVYLLVENWESVEPIFLAVKDAILGAGEAVLGWLRDNWPLVATLLSGPFAPIVLLATDGFGVRTALVGALTDMVSAVGTKIGEVIGYFTALPGNILATLGDFSGLLYGLGTAALQGLWNGFTDLYNVFQMQTLWNLGGDIVAAIGDVGALLFNVGWALIVGIKDGVVAAWQAFSGTILKYADPRNWDIPGRSPLLEAFEHTGRDAGTLLMQGITLGIVEAAPQTIAAMTRYAQQMLRAGHYEAVRNVGSLLAGTSVTDTYNHVGQADWDAGNFAMHPSNLDEYNQRQVAFYASFKQPTGYGGGGGGMRIDNVTVVIGAGASDADARRAADQVVSEIYSGARRRGMVF